MKRHLLLGASAAFMLMACVGCQAVQKGTNVQKGSAIGGGAGAILGAGIGQLSTFGGVPGALVGLGLGATAGAIAGDQLYGAETEEGLVGTEEIDTLNTELGAKSTQIAELRDTLEREEAQKQALLEAHEQVSNQLRQLQGNVGGDIEVGRDAEGSIKFTILSEVLFASGKAALTPKGEAVLAKAAQTIRAQFPEAVIEVRGHTDNVPIRYSRHASNWELSCARALSVVHYLIEAESFPPDKLMAVGLADTKPLASNDTPEGRRTNRRAEMLIRSGAQLAARTPALQ